MGTFKHKKSWPHHGKIIGFHRKIWEIDVLHGWYGFTWEDDKDICGMWPTILIFYVYMSNDLGIMDFLTQSHLLVGWIPSWSAVIQRKHLSFNNYFWSWNSWNYMEVSWNRVTPKSSIYRWIFHYKPSILGTPISGNPQMVQQKGMIWASNLRLAESLLRVHQWKLWTNSWLHGFVAS